jgi:hypothetical protein
MSQLSEPRFAFASASLGNYTFFGEGYYTSSADKILAKSLQLSMSFKRLLSIFHFPIPQRILEMSLTLL